jgi:hypothetical protein
MKPRVHRPGFFFCQCNCGIVRRLLLSSSCADLLAALAGAGPMQASGLLDHRDARGKYGLVHNIGLGGAAVVSLLRRPEFYREGGPDGRDRYFSFPVFPCGLRLTWLPLGWGIITRTSSGRLRVQTWIRSSRRHIRKGYLGSQSCEPLSFYVAMQSEYILMLTVDDIYTLSPTDLPAGSSQLMPSSHLPSLHSLLLHAPAVRVIAQLQDVSSLASYQYSRNA